jgi:hypothetical protein
MKPRVRIRRSSNKVYRRLQDGPVLPPWVKVVPYVLGVIIFVFVSLQLFREDPPPAFPEAQDNFDAAVDVAGDLFADPSSRELLDDVASGSTVLAAPPDAEETFSGLDEAGPVLLQLESGGTVEISASALAVARAATLALFTGNFDGIPAADGVTFPDIARTWPDPYIGDPVVVSVGDGTISFSFRVDPDREGVEPTYKTASMVLFVPARGWVWAGV